MFFFFLKMFFFVFFLLETGPRPPKEKRKKSSYDHGDSHRGVFKDESFILWTNPIWHFHVALAAYPWHIVAVSQDSRPYCLK